MRALCVVLLVLVTVKAEDAFGDGGEELGCEGGGEDPENSVDPEGSGAESEELDEEDLMKNFGIDVKNISGDVCKNFTHLNSAVRARIKRDDDVNATLDENFDCMCVRMAMRVLQEKKPPTSFPKLYYAYTDIDDGLPDTDIAEQLWKKGENWREGEKGGIMSDLLSVALGENVTLKHGCAKDPKMAICTFAPPQNLLEKFEEKVEEQKKKDLEEIEKLFAMYNLDEDEDAQ